MAHEPFRSVQEVIMCREIAEWASAYLDEHVQENRKQQIALHLAVCAGCRAYVDQIVTVRHLVRLLPKAMDSTDDSERARRAVAAKLRRQ